MIIMSIAIIPKMKKIPEGATKEDRQRMFQEYRAELIKYNPSHFNPDGSVKSFWQLIRFW